MAPGGGVCKEVVESHPKYANYDITAAKAEKRSTQIKSNSGWGEKHGMPSTNGVHELLECPVCKNLMYPPIHQVCININFGLPCFSDGHLNCTWKNIMPPDFS